MVVDTGPHGVVQECVFTTIFLIWACDFIFFVAVVLKLKACHEKWILGTDTVEKYSRHSKFLMTIFIMFIIHLQ